MWFGANLDPVRGAGAELVRLARRCEALDLDFVTIQDHPYQAAFHDTWTLLTWLAASTERITFVPTVANLPLRPPAMLAKAAVSLDELSGGRLQLGVGAGAFWDAIVAMGGPRRSPKEAADALSEGLDVIRAMWSGERAVRVAGEHYAIKGVHPGPAPSPSLGVWVGVYGPRTLRITGEKADGWIPSLGFLPVDRLAEASRRIDDAAAHAGRDRDAVRKVYNLNGMIHATTNGPFDGPADQWVDDIVGVVMSAGIAGVSFWPIADHEHQLDVYAAEVVPAVKAALASEPIAG